MPLKIHSKEDKFYMVVGCPKSATSLIANGLRLQGADMGESVRSRNASECGEVVQLNAEILRAATTSTKAPGHVIDPPDEDEILNLNFTEKIKAYIKSRKGKMWGFKDPRASLTGKLFFPYLDGDVYLFWCFRKPRKVKKSYR